MQRIRFVRDFLRMGIVAGLWLSASAGRASDPQALRVSVPSTAAAPVLDGKVEGAWVRGATRVGNFQVRVGDQMEAARYVSEVYLQHDREHVYIGLILFTPEDHVAYSPTSASERDQALWTEDSIELFFGTPGDPDRYFQLIGSRSGAVTDLRYGDGSWRGSWSYRAAGHSDRWEAQFKIPLATLGVSYEEGLALPFQLARNQRMPSETSLLAPYASKVREMNWSGLRRSEMVLTEATAVEIEPISVLSPARVGGWLRSPAAEMDAVLRVSEAVSGEVLARRRVSGAPGEFTFELPEIPYGGPYQAELLVRHGEAAELFRMPFRLELPLRVTANPRVLRDVLEWSLFYYGPDLPDRYVLRFVNLERDEEHQRLEIEGRRRVEQSMDLHTFPEGRYRLEAQAFREGNQIESRDVEFEVLARPEWLGNTLGVADEVMTPWTPIATREDAVLCWGREVRFGALLPRSLVSQGQDLLAAPMTIEGRAGGRPFTLAGPPARIELESEARAVIRGRAEGGGVAVETETVMEYDGLMRVRLRVRPEAGMEIEHLALRIPLGAAQTGLRTQRVIWGATLEEYEELLGEQRDHDALEGPSWTNRIEPIWIGNEDVGLSFEIEGPRNLFLERPDEAMRFNTAGERADLVITFMDRPAGEGIGELDYEFGLMATPSKPWPEDGYRGWNTVIASASVWWGSHVNFVHSPEIMDWLRDQGVETIIDMSDWTVIHDSMVDYQSDWLHKWVAESRARGMKTLAYFGHGVTTGTPEWDQMADETLREPRSAPFSLPTTPGHLTYRTCANSLYVDYVAWRIDYVMRTYGIDGIYLDEWGTAPCMNEHHGCGYVDRHGVRRPLTPGFAFREEMKRIYRLVKSINPEGIVFLHGRQELGALNFSDVFLTGEQLIPFRQATRPAMLEMLPLSAFRADFTGRPFGVPGTMYVYHNLPWRNHEALAVTLLHDTPTVQAALYGAERRANLEETARAWRALNENGAHEGEFLGYWRQRLLTTPEPLARISLYRTAPDRLLAVAALFAENRDVEIAIDAAALGWTGRTVSAADALTGETIPVEDGALRLGLEQDNFRMFTLKAE